MTQTPSHFTIKDWSEDDRPREKLLQKGPQSLSNAELLAILIGSGSKKESAKTLDIRVLDHLIISEKGYFSFAD